MAQVFDNILNQPQIVELDVTGLSVPDGQPIRIRATDDTQVAKVSSAIL